MRASFSVIYSAMAQARKCRFGTDAIVGGDGC